MILLYKNLKQKKKKKGMGNNPFNSKIKYKGKIVKSPQSLYVNNRVNTKKIKKEKKIGKKNPKKNSIKTIEKIFKNHRQNNSKNDTQIPKNEKQSQIQENQEETSEDYNKYNYKNNNSKNSSKNSCNFKTIRFNKLHVGPLISKKKKVPEIDELLPQIPFMLSFCAPRNSGKTNCLVTFLIDRNFCYKKFEKILIWTPTFYLDKTWEVFRKSYKENEDYKVFTEYDKRDVIDCIETIKELKIKYPDRHYLFIFDDMGDQDICTNYNIGPVGFLAVKGRHYNISAIMSSQKRTMLSTSIRSNLTNEVIFSLTNAKEEITCSEECRGHLTHKEFLHVLHYATNEKHNFLHIISNPDKRSYQFRKNWNEIIITPDTVTCDNI